MPDAAELLHAVEVDLGLLARGILRLDARFERLDLQRELGVDHQGDAVAGGDLIALAHTKRHDGAADAGAGRQLAHRLDRGDDGLAVVDLLAGHGLLGGGGLEDAGHQQQGGGGLADHSAFPRVSGPSCIGLDRYISNN